MDVDSAMGMKPLRRQALRTAESPRLRAHDTPRSFWPEAPPREWGANAGFGPLLPRTPRDSSTYLPRPPPIRLLPPAWLPMQITRPQTDDEILG